MPRFINPVSQYLDSTGAIVSGGTLSFYDTGSLTFKDIWSDSAQAVSAPNPLPLYGDGRVPSVFLEGAYRVVLKDSSGAQIWERDPVSGDIDSSFGSDWDASFLYQSTAVVRDAGFYWISLVNDNIGNRPSTDGGTNWERIGFRASVGQADTYADVRALTASYPFETIIVGGHSSVGDGGAGTFYLDAADVVSADNDGTILVDAAGRRWKRIHDGSVSILAFGFDTLAADNSAAILSAFNAAKTGAFELNGYTGEAYIYTSDVIVTGATSLTIRGDCTFAGTAAGIYISGSISEIGTVSVAATKDDQSVTLTSATGFEQGDIAILWNSITSSYSPHRAEYYDGEFAKVRSVAGAVVTLETPILTSYPAVTTSKVYKMTPVVMTLEGCSFTGGSLYSLKVTNGYQCDLRPTLVKNTRVGGQAALAVDRLYMSKVEGGEYFRHEGAVGTGDDYGINVVNCQNLDIDMIDAYARRHPVTTGGDANPAAVPCRFIRVRTSKLVNDPASSVYAADFHGNTLDSYYEDCEVYGAIGLAGENVYARRCKVHTWANNDIPLSYHELVGGDCGFIDCEVQQNSGNTATEIIGTTSSGLSANITKRYRIFATGLKAELTANTVRIMNIFENSGQINDWLLEDWEVSGTLSYAEIASAAITGAGISPRTVHIRKPRYQPGISYLNVSAGSLATSFIKLPSDFGTNANGTFQRLEDGTMICSYTLSASSTAISTAFLGGFRTAGLTWTFPSTFSSAPSVTGIAANASAAGVVESTTSTTAITLFLTAFASQGAATVSAKLDATGRWYDY